MYITTYAADAQPPLDMRRLLQHYDNSSLLSKCKHHLMDGTGMRKQSSQVRWKTTSPPVTLECASEGCGEEFEQINKYIKSHQIYLI